MENIVALIQVRMNSSRLPDKALVNIQGRPCLGQVYKRLTEVNGITKIVVATSSDSSCDPIADFCQKEDIPMYRGEEEDLLDRLYQAAKEHNADSVIRLTADCPVVVPSFFSDLISFFQKGDYDFASNNPPQTYPHGVDAEIMKFSTLEHAWKTEKDERMRALATYTIFGFPDKYKLGTMSSTEDLSHLRITLDYAEDLDVIKGVFAHLSPNEETFTLNGIKSLYASQPEIFEANACHHNHSKMSDRDKLFGEKK